MRVPTGGIVTLSQVQQLAAMIGLTVPEGRLASVAARLQAMRYGAALIDELPLREVEPATVFKPEPTQA